MWRKCVCGKGVNGRVQQPLLCEIERTMSLGRQRHLRLNCLAVKVCKSSKPCTRSGVFRRSPVELLRVIDKLKLPCSRSNRPSLWCRPRMVWQGREEEKEIRYGSKNIERGRERERWIDRQTERERGG